MLKSNKYEFTDNSRKEAELLVQPKKNKSTTNDVAIIRQETLQQRESALKLVKKKSNSVKNLWATALSYVIVEKK